MGWRNLLTLFAAGSWRSDSGTPIMERRGYYHIPRRAIYHFCGEWGTWLSLTWFYWLIRFSALGLWRWLGQEVHGRCSKLQGKRRFSPLSVPLLIIFKRISSCITSKQNRDWGMRMTQFWMLVTYYMESVLILGSHMGGWMVRTFTIPFRKKKRSQAVTPLPQKYLRGDWRLLQSEVSTSNWKVLGICLWGNKFVRERNSGKMRNLRDEAGGVCHFGQYFLAIFIQTRKDITRC